MPGNVTNGSFQFVATDNNAGTYTVTCLGPLGENGYGPLGTPGSGSATLTVNNYCSSSYVTVTDSYAISQALGWGGSEPWERGVTISCEYTYGVNSGSNYRDSFGQFYSGYSPTMDPCALNLVNQPSPSTSVVAGILHSHPYFMTNAQYLAGVGCHGANVPLTSAQLNSLNIQNQNFSSGDLANWDGTGKPQWLRVPLANSVKRRNTTLNQTVTVYP